MKKNILVISLVLLATSLSAQNVKRAYKSLEKKEFGKAKEAFSKLLAENNENVACNFGMAMILADDQSPLFDIIDSWQYIEAIQGKESQLTQDEMGIMGEYFLNTEVRRTSRPVKKKVSIAVEAVEARLIKYIREENNLEACYEVLERYPNFKHYDNVVHIRNQFEFRKYEKINTQESYTDFIQKFPDAAQVSKAKRYRDAMAFEEIKAKNSVLAFNQYIESFPNSRYVPMAIKYRNAAAYSEAEQTNSLAAYEGFIANYPDAIEVSEAKQHQRELLYEKAKKIKSLEAYNKFISLYPEGGYYLDVFNLKSSDLGMAAYPKLFNSADLNWSMALDNNNNIDEAKAITATAEGGYLVAGLTRESDSAFADAWIIKLDGKGQMQWNKTVGQPFEDDIINIMESSKGEVVVVGYTKVSADSNAKNMGWMFLLGKDGSRVWNKNLGELNISACEMGHDDKIHMATYTNDTIPGNYFIQSYNLEGNKISERDFVNKGYFNDIIFSSENKVFLAGTKWFALTDQKYYLNWEDTLKLDAPVRMASMNSQLIVLQAHDTTTSHLIGYSINGQKKWQIKEYLTDSFEQKLDLLVTSKNQILVLENDFYISKAAQYSLSGVKTAETMLKGEYKFKKAIQNNKGGITYLMNGKDLLVISFSSLGF